MSSSQIAENYQLKWHSHLTNLNSSVATLFRNDKFADVLLFTSQSDGGCGIPAHKIILSSCSHFFAQIFELNPAPPNSMVYIVLPPELSKRSIQILIQYMYSGEATVSNDILNEVLHGGELLKIRGLCRNKQTQAPVPPGPPINETTPAAHYAMPTEVACEKPIYEPHHSDRLVNNASSSNLSIIKESPVIVTSPPHLKHSNMVESLPPQSHVHHVHQNDVQYQKKMENDKKEMTINEINNELVSVPTSHYGLVSLQIAAAVKKAQQISEKRCVKMVENGNNLHCSSGGAAALGSSATLTTTAPNNNNNANSTNNNNNGRNTTPYNHRRYSDDYFGKDDGIPSGSHPNIQEIDASRHNLPRHLDKNRIASPPSAKHSQRLSAHHLEPIIERNNSSRNAFDKTSAPLVMPSVHSHQSHQHQAQQRQPQSNQIPEDLQLMDIKQEPVEWPDFEHDNAGIDKPNIEIAVKPELIYAKDDTDEEGVEQQEPIYSPLTCELCSETFTVPAEWVRHIESHSEPSSHCVPKKRKRIESNSLTENIAALRCDLCAMYFVTPAEWVRHVQNHTETELALSNNSLRQPATVNSSSTSSHRLSRQSQQPPPPQHIDNSSKYSHPHPQTNSHR